jgi:glycosyltransferase involved in cell wall biosynthesis
VKRVLFLRSNPVDPDPRVEKEAAALAEIGYEVKVLGWDRTGQLTRVVSAPFGVVERIPLRARFGAGLRNLPGLLRFQLALAAYLIRNRKAYDVIHACDFDTALTGYLLGRLLGKRVIYDVFDFYAEMLRKTPSWLKSLVRAIDLKLMGWVDAVILADESRVEQIRGAKPKRLAFIYNVPDIPSLPPLPPDPPPLRIAYVGLLQVERGILEVLKILEKHRDWELDLAGFGGDEARILEIAKRLPNVRFHSRVPYERALELAANAHVLFATYDPAIPNHRYSSANKLFEAMALGKPIVVARGTGMDRLVHQEKIGFVVTYGKLDELEKAFLEVASWDGQTRQAFARRVRALYESKFSWSIMKEELRGLYNLILGEPC